MKRRVFFLQFFILVILSVFSPANSKPFIYSNENEIEDLGEFIEIMEDPTNKIGINEALSSKNYKLSKDKVPNLGVSNSSFWLKFQITNKTNISSLLLQLALPTIDEIEFYTVLPNGNLLIQKTGEIYKFSSRKFNHPRYLFSLNLMEGQTGIYYMKIRATEQLQIPLTVGNEQNIIETLINLDVIAGLYFGIILVMFLYNLFIFITVRDISYLYYVVYIIVIGLTQASFLGYSAKYLWPNSQWLTLHSVILTSSLGAIAGMTFIKIFLQTKLNAPNLHKGLNIFIGIMFICIALALFDFYQLSYQILQLNAMFSTAFIIYLAITIAKRGNRSAKFFLVSWFMFLAGTCIFVLKDYNILPYNTFTYYTMAAGTGIEVILLSFALGDRINILKKEKEDSQAQVLKALRENERMIKEQNIVLEQKVSERTFELRNSNQELGKTLKNLKETQAQLVGAEKMASLGQLTAGIAHEINNPINFVSSNIKPLKKDIDDILSLLYSYKEINSESEFLEKLEEIKKLEDQLDINYLIEEINLLLKGIDDGANRTAEIVKGLRTFSRLDEIDIKRIDINEGIESTLTILNNNLRDKINIVKDLGTIPKIECYPGKINQVFMNIINNAIQAIPDKGNIFIKTSYVDKYVYISIKDTGIGMSEEVKSKIFDPFFTTKDVGEGTGLGLSIVHNIIETHKGEIKVESLPNQGTEFIIILPELQT